MNERAQPLVHGRFEVVEPSRNWLAVIDLRDAETGRAAMMMRSGYWLEEASSYAMASWVRDARRTDLAKVLALQPTVLARGTDEGTPSAIELGRLTISLIERSLDLAAEGITSLPGRAWIVRRDERWDVVVPAGLGVGGELHFDQRFAGKRWPVTQDLLRACLGWLDVRLHPGSPQHVWRAPSWLSRVSSGPEALSAIAEHLGAPELAAHPWKERGAPWRRIDFALAETLGEAALEQALQDPGRRYDALPFAALLHRRACIELRAGDVDHALVTVERAIAIDPCARHHTTRALMLEALGREAEARAAHEAAIAAVPDRLDVDGVRVIGDDESVHDARSAHAWGAFLARHGELTAAATWLERAVIVDEALGPDLHRAMRLGAWAVVLLRLGQHERAAEVAARALTLDPAEPSARAVRTRLEAAG